MTDTKILRIVPQVLRARGWRLYTGKGRLVDLWQYGGRAVLGHKSPGQLRVFKNGGERGLFTPLPHFAEARLYKALSALLPGRSFRLYPQENLMPLLQKIPADNIAVWRPYMNDPALQTAPVLLPVLPCPFPGVPAVIALKADSPADLPELPPSPLLPPVPLIAAARSIYDLLANPERGSPRCQKIDRSLKNAVWKRQGIYLFYSPVSNEENEESTEAEIPESYAALFRHFLEQGFLLPPSPNEPAILPGELSPGEEAKLAAALKEC